MAKSRRSYLLLSLASSAVVSAAVLPGCSGTVVTGLVVAPPDGGTGGIAGTSGVGSPGGAGGTDGRPCRGSPCGIIIQPAHAGAAGVAGAAGDAGVGGGGGGPCGGHFCGSLAIPPGSSGEAGATS